MFLRALSFFCLFIIQIYSQLMTTTRRTTTKSPNTVVGATTTKSTTTTTVSMPTSKLIITTLTTDGGDTMMTNSIQYSSTTAVSTSGNTIQFSTTILEKTTTLHELSDTSTIFLKVRSLLGTIRVRFFFCFNSLNERIIFVQGNDSTVVIGTVVGGCVLLCCKSILFENEITN